MNVLGSKKLKSRSPGVTESRSFLVRYRRTYVLKNIIVTVYNHGIQFFADLEEYPHVAMVKQLDFGWNKKVISLIQSTKILLIPSKCEIIFVTLKNCKFDSA